VTNRRPTILHRTPAQRPATDAYSSGSPPDVDQTGATIYGPHTRRPSSLGHPFTLQWPPEHANEGIVAVEEAWRCSLCHTYQFASTLGNPTFGQYKQNTKLSPLGDLRTPSMQRGIGRAYEGSKSDWSDVTLWLGPHADVPPTTVEPLVCTSRSSPSVRVNPSVPCASRFGLEMTPMPFGGARWV
jgi:hypothetical protein